MSYTMSDLFTKFNINAKSKKHKEIWLLKKPIEIISYCCTQLVDLGNLTHGEISGY